MKKILLLLGVVFCISNGAVLAQPAELTGNQILKKSIAAYEALPRYSGATAAFQQTDFVGGLHTIQTATAIITYKKSLTTMHVTGQVFDGNSYHIDGNDKGATIKQNSTAGSKIHTSTWKYANISDALLGMIGESAGIPTFIAEALNGCGCFLSEQSEAKLLGKENIRGVDCYKVVTNENLYDGGFPGPPDTPDIPLTNTLKCTYWINAKNFLLLQMYKEEKYNWKEYKKVMYDDLFRKAPSPGIRNINTFFTFINGAVTAEDLPK